MIIKNLIVLVPTIIRIHIVTSRLAFAVASSPAISPIRQQWKDLSEELKQYATLLGFNETSWSFESYDNSHPFPVTTEKFQDLKDREKEAVLSLHLENYFDMTSPPTNRLDYLFWINNNQIRYHERYSDNMVLQRAPASASITGFLGDSKCPEDPALRPMVIVSIHQDKEDYESHPSPAIYAVDAEVYPDKELGSDRCAFRAIFPPTKMGGSYTFEARYMTSLPDKTAKIKHVTFGDVWVCSGQSNMALPLAHTLNHKRSEEKVKGGEYDNIHLYGIASNMNHRTSWIRAKDAVEKTIFHDFSRNYLTEFSATCYYFAERLTDEFRERGENPPPIGLIHTAYGGSRIEDWLDNSTIASCTDISYQTTGQKGGLHFTERIVPSINTTIKGWIWYQGANNMNWRAPTIKGNSERGSGYSCLQVELVALWRKLWSKTAGTTDPEAPFGIVTLPWSGSEGEKNMGIMRWAQTGSYGVLPNTALPNTFLAHAYDVDEPFQQSYNPCSKFGCCNPSEGLAYPSGFPKPCTQNSEANLDKISRQFGGFQCDMCDMCADLCKSAREDAPFYMGVLHPRLKYPIGERLALAAARSVYNLGDGSYIGPTIAGCEVDSDGKVVKVVFDRNLLGDDIVHVQSYNRNQTWRSKMEVLLHHPADGVEVGLCLETFNGDCLDDGHGNSFEWKGKGDAISTWTPVDILTQGDASNGGIEIVVDLSSVNASNVIAIRYMWEGNCCISQHETDNTIELHTRYCPPNSCPIYSKSVGLPANPFLAEIIDGRCKCISPQVCDVSAGHANPTKEVTTFLSTAFERLRSISRGRFFVPVSLSLLAFFVLVRRATAAYFAKREIELTKQRRRREIELQELEALVW